MMMVRWPLISLMIWLMCLTARGQVNIQDDYDGTVTHTVDANRGTGEIYTSMHQLQEFFDKEREYVSDIRMIIEKKLVSQNAIASLGAYVASFEDVIGGQEEDASFLNHPLNVYNLIRHVAVAWNMVEETLKQEKKNSKGQLPKRVRKVMTRSKRDHVPAAADLDGVSAGIVRLHDYYNFNLTSFVNEGVLETDQIRAESNGDLSVWDAFKIGVRGANSLILGSGIEIMLHAYDKAVSDGIVSVPPFIEQLDVKVLKNLIKTAKTVHDQKLDRWGARTPQHSTNPQPYDRRLARKKKFQNPKEKQIILNDIRISESQEKEQYLELCRGKDLRPASVTKDLQCKYVHKNKPYYRYGPRKVEILSNDPFVYLIHDFIMPSEIEAYIKSAGPRLRRSEVAGKNGTGSADEVRVSEQTWINEDTPAAARLTQRIDDFLDFQSKSTEHSELYQVANYGLGGLYDMHFDPVLADDVPNNMQKRSLFNIYAGDRLATLMGYLSDVAAGGYTVFPHVGAYSKPVKGAMLVWFSMDDLGGYDHRLRHGGCPVLIGNKWITNKWVRAHSQMFKRPCPLYTGRQLRKFRDLTRFRKGGIINQV